MAARQLYLLALILSVATVQAADFPEKHYQKEWCDQHNGIMEVRLDDNTRIDCLTRDYAVEVEFSRKWAEGIGQSLYYAAMTDKSPGVVLVLDHPNAAADLHRLQLVAAQAGVTVWPVNQNAVGTYAGTSCNQ